MIRAREFTHPGIGALRPRYTESTHPTSRHQTCLPKSALILPSHPLSATDVVSTVLLFTLYLLIGANMMSKRGIDKSASVSGVKKGDGFFISFVVGIREGSRSASFYREGVREVPWWCAGGEGSGA